MLALSVARSTAAVSIAITVHSLTLDALCASMQTLTQLTTLCLEFASGMSKLSASAERYTTPLVPPQRRKGTCTAVEGRCGHLR